MQLPAHDDDDEYMVVDLINDVAVFPDGAVGEITVLIDKDGYPTLNYREAFLAICAHPDGGFADMELEDEHRAPPGNHG